MNNFYLTNHYLANYYIKNKNEFSWEAMKNKVDELFTQYIPDLPKKVELKLPTLKKIELPKLKKVK